MTKKYTGVRPTHPELISASQLDTLPPGSIVSVSGADDFFYEKTWNGDFYTLDEHVSNCTAQQLFNEYPPIHLIFVAD